MDVIKKKHWWQSDALKWSVLGLLGLLVGYLVVLMYAQGEYLFAITTLILSSAAGIGLDPQTCLVHDQHL